MIRLLLAAFCIAFWSAPMAASASKMEWDAETEEKEAVWTFGAPGELTIDAGDGQAAFPSLTAQLSFLDWEEFGAFMAQVFNAKVTYPDPKSGKPLIEVSVAVLGVPLAVDVNGGGVVEVANPISEFLGGPFGYLSIGGQAFCVNERLCGGKGVMGEPVGALEQTFSISGASVRDRYLFTFPPAVAYDYVARTQQVEGGYKRLVVRLSGPLSLQCFDFLGRSVCVATGGIITIRRGRNSLSVDMMIVKGEAGCVREVKSYSEHSSNVPAVSVHAWVFSGSGTWSPLLEADGIRSFHVGWDPELGYLDSKDSFWGSGDSLQPLCD